jgi:hypothetical protein
LTIVRRAALLLAVPLSILPAAAAPAVAPPVRVACERLYVAVWRIDYDNAGQVAQVTLQHVIDPTNGRTPEEAASRPIQMELPPAYLAAARAFLARRPRQPGGPSPAYSWTFFDPAQPGRADILSPTDCARAA